MLQAQDNSQNEQGKTPKLDSLTSHQGAQILADRVALYWAARGHSSVQVWTWKAPPVGEPHGRNRYKHVVWCVRSNLVNGLPP